MSVDKHIRRRAELARGYAADGDLHSCAQTLSTLADDIAEFARLADRFVGAMVEEGKCSPSDDGGIS